MSWPDDMVEPRGLEPLTLPCKGGSMQWAFADQCRRVALKSTTLLSPAGGCRLLSRVSLTSCLVPSGGSQERPIQLLG